MSALPRLPIHRPPMGLFLANLLDATLDDPAAGLVLLALLAASFGAAVDARKRWMEGSWSFRVWFNVATSATFALIAVAWAIWLAGTGD